MRFMSEQSSIGNRQSPIPPGFTLLEVVVAIGLLGILMAAAVELLAVGVRSAKASGDYTQAVMLGKQKLDEIALQPLLPGTSDGAVDGGYRWSAEIVPERQDAEVLPAKLFRLRVRVSWRGRLDDKAVELVTLRTAMVEEKAELAPQPSGAQGASPRGSRR